MRVSMRFAAIITLIAMGMTTLSLSATGPAAAQSAKRYVLVGAGNSLPMNLEALVASVGGQVVSELGEIGVAIVESAEPNFADAVASIAGLQGVAEDRPVPLALPNLGDTTAVESLDTEAAPEGVVAEALSNIPCTNPPTADCNPALAFFLPIQWNLKAIGAPAAWGVELGNPSVKVAVIDTGIDYTHQEFQRRVNGQVISIVDPVLSKSFFNEFDWPKTPLPPNLPAGFVPKDYADFNGHGTHVAGIIAAGGVRLAGVAPNVTLIALKVADRRGFATWTTIIDAIKYAADVGADVINMSFGDCLVKNGRIDPNSVPFGKCIANGARQNAQLMAALNRAVNYAHGKGALIVASAGNDGIDWDRSGNVMKLPAQLPHVVAVSATGPRFGGVIDPSGSNIDAMGIAATASGPIVYTDHGMSIITFAGPGGSVTSYLGQGTPFAGMPLDRIFSACSRFTILSTLPPTDPNAFPCRGSGTGRPFGISNTFMVGTSMAAAHVSGVAALVDSAAGGTLTGDQIMEILMQSADDFGKPGKDEWYGFGRINAYRAVTGK